MSGAITAFGYVFIIRYELLKVNTFVHYSSPTRGATLTPMADDKNDTPPSLADNDPAPPLSPRKRSFVDSTFAGLVSGLLVAIAVASLDGLKDAVTGSSLNLVAVGFFVFFVLLVTMYGFLVHDSWKRNDQRAVLIVLSALAFVCALLLLWFFLMALNS